MFIEKNFEWNGYTIPYLIDFPDGYSPEKQYPVLVYLHGYGFVFGDIEKLKAECPARRERIPQNRISFFFASALASSILA